MSRWLSAFENHAFHVPWNKIKKQLSEIEVADITIHTDVEELARLKKAATFVDGILNGCDPDLIPAVTWTNFQQQAQTCLDQITAYIQNKNIGHLTNANANIDNLLTYVRPYMLVEGRVGRTMQASLREYNKTIGSVIESFKESATATLDEIESLKATSQKAEQETIEIKEKFDELDTNYFQGSEDKDALAVKVESLVNGFETHYKKITDLHAKLFVGDDEDEAIADTIEDAKTKSVSSSENIETLLSENKNNVSALVKFHKEIFGSKNKEGKIISGLKKELDDRKDQLDTFEGTQKEKYTAILEEIESLLPGATSAGLATAYYDLKKSFIWPIRLYSGGFYISVISLLVLGILLVNQSIPLMTIELSPESNITNFGFGLFQKLILFVPIVWLALFSSKRRSEAQRLQQEYAHKEATAKSYQSFKKQISELQEGSDDKLIKELISSVIETVSYNASSTLDGKHGDNSPMHDAFEQFLNSKKPKSEGQK